MEEEVKKVVYETKGKVEEMSKRLDDIGLRLNHLGEGQEMMRREMTKLKDSLNERIDGVNDSLNGSIDGLKDKIDSNFKWLVGIILGTVLPMWITIIIAILFK